MFKVSADGRSTDDVKFKIAHTIIAFIKKKRLLIAKEIGFKTRKQSAMFFCGSWFYMSVRDHWGKVASYINALNLLRTLFQSCTCSPVMLILRKDLNLSSLS